ncbi:hypothetical protein LSCM4_08261 [Leishmania orientalis]|uniref:Uncharacterized protein n=1 Tax=Leishmania orientalis TaxID=2249476 RepID=A0A836GTT1_9TRYP|nr:hypothetical protein LSCM4_08261 [Leishmania orientalis]
MMRRNLCAEKEGLNAKPPRFAAYPTPISKVALETEPNVVPYSQTGEASEAKQLKALEGIIPCGTRGGGHLGLRQLPSKRVDSRGSTPRSACLAFKDSHVLIGRSSDHPAVLHSLPSESELKHASNVMKSNSSLPLHHGRAA